MIVCVLVFDTIVTFVSLTNVCDDDVKPFNDVIPLEDDHVGKPPETVNT